MTKTEILRLVEQALNEMDDRSLETTLRRVVRIATLLGDTQAAIRFTLDLKSPRGSTTANQGDIMRLLPDAALWTSKDGPHFKAANEYMEDRDAGNNKVHIHGVIEIESIVAMMSDKVVATSAKLAQERQTYRELLQRIRIRAFIALCGWERELSFSSTNEQIFTRYQSRVDKVMTAVAPDIVSSFNAVYRRLRDAKITDSEASEELAQAVTTCRRILKAVADHVFPPKNEETPEGNKLNDATYRNRIKEFTKRYIESKSAREATDVSIDGLYDRFAALDAYTSKGVHASLAMEEAESCAINTYVLSGEILRLAKEKSKN